MNRSPIHITSAVAYTPSNIINVSNSTLVGNSAFDNTNYGYLILVGSGGTANLTDTLFVNVDRGASVMSKSVLNVVNNKNAVYDFKRTAFNVTYDATVNISGPGKTIINGKGPYLMLHPNENSDPINGSLIIVDYGGIFNFTNGEINTIGTKSNVIGRYRNRDFVLYQSSGTMNLSDVNINAYGQHDLVFYNNYSRATLYNVNMLAPNSNGIENIGGGWGGHGVDLINSNIITNGYGIKSTDANATFANSNVTSKNGNTVSYYGYFIGNFSRDVGKTSLISSLGDDSTTIYADGTVVKNDLYDSSFLMLYGASIYNKGNDGTGVYVGKRVHGKFFGGIAQDTINAAITTDGDNSIGVHINTDKDLYFNNYNVTTNGKKSIGIKLTHPKGDIVLDSDYPYLHDYNLQFNNIETKNDDSIGMIIDRPAYTTFSYSTINANGNNSSAVLLGGQDHHDYDEHPDLVNSIVFYDNNINSYSGNAIESKSGYKTQLMVNDSIITSNQYLIKSDGYKDLGNGKFHNSNLDTKFFDSTLSGATFVGDNDVLKMELVNTKWSLNSTDGKASSLTKLNLKDNNHVDFKLSDNYEYQTLYVGKGIKDKTIVFSSEGKNTISLNTFLNEGGDLSNQRTDRLLINGNVQGETLLDIREMEGSTGGMTGFTNTDGISIVQVNGIASKDSFKLAYGPITMNSLPFIYDLYAFDPNESSANQRLVKGDGHWDWRLQSVCIGPCPAPPTPPTTPKEPDDKDKNKDPKPPVSPPITPPVASKPQLDSHIPNYILMPEAAFAAGNEIMSNLHSRIKDYRKRGIDDYMFMRNIGFDYGYKTNKTNYDYQYDAKFKYNAIQMGGMYKATHIDNIKTSFGLSVNTGNLSLSPTKWTGANKTTMKIHGLSLYSSTTYKDDFYVDLIASANHVYGDVNHKLKGKRSDVSANLYSGSIEIGKSFLVNNNLSFIPRVQLTHQQLNFRKTNDKGGFVVDQGKHKNTNISIGTEITYDLSNKKNLQLTGNIDYIKSFRSNNDIYLGRNFTPATSGDHIRAGVGLTSFVGKNTNIFLTTNRHQKVGNKGNGGFSYNVGVNIRF